MSATETPVRVPVSAYGMRTATGERRVSKLVARIVPKPRSHREVVILLRTGLMNIERQSPEVRNDAVREQICRALDDYCDSSRIERVNCSEF